MLRGNRMRKETLFSNIKFHYILSVILFSTSFLFSATKTFDGGSGGSGTNWGVAANWDGDTLPVDGDDIIIPTGFNTTVDAGFGSVVLASLTINGTGSVTCWVMTA